MTDFSNRKIISIAPGRVCLFGDHQDYLGLPIIACAIDRFVEIEGIENNSEFFQIDLPDLKKTLSIPIKSDKNPKNGNHLEAVLRVLRKYGCLPDRGYDIKISGNIPINAGLSSSSAVVVAWINFLVEAFGINQTINPELTALIAYQAEVLEVGGSGGKMDQYAISIGDVIYLETDKNAHFEKLKVPNMSMIVGESGIPKATTSILKDRKENAQKAIEIVENEISGFSIYRAEISDLKDYLEVLPKNLHDYFNAAVKNYDVTKRALSELKKNQPNIEIVGELINEHHSILKNELDLTVPKIDAMVESAIKAGAVGAKIVGSGKGGSILAISEPGSEEPIIEAMKKAGAIDAYKVNISSGPTIKIVEHAR